mmetsp:Transcript_17842/g.37437  ORF Transcript_17842/g.37437 Transcript_17842/m.37437 type:complete len:126 (-) Transcript_17842:858-1235(-)
MLLIATHKMVFMLIIIHSKSLHPSIRSIPLSTRLFHHDDISSSSVVKCRIHQWKTWNHHDVNMSMPSTDDAEFHQHSILCQQHQKKPWKGPAEKENICGRLSYASHRRCSLSSKLFAFHNEVRSA